MTKLADRTEVELLPPGTRIRHKRHTLLKGRISHYEMCRDGSVSAIPYNIAWDDNHAAAGLLGSFFMYGDTENVEVDSERPA